MMQPFRGRSRMARFLLYAQGGGRRRRRGRCPGCMARNKGEFVRSSTAARSTAGRATRRRRSASKTAHRRREHETPVPHNEFLCTRRSYENFILRAECKLVGLANGGIQIRSSASRKPRGLRLPGRHQRGPNGGEWGCLYDESRRGRLVHANRNVIKKAIKPNDWNLYEIRCEGRTFGSC